MRELSIHRWTILNNSDMLPLNKVLKVLRQYKKGDGVVNQYSVDI